MEKVRLALIGANGMLASMVKQVAPDACRILPFDLPEFDLTDRDQVLRILEAAKPEIILNCAAFTNVDRCETEEELATRVNGHGPGYLAEAALVTGAALVHLSTDYVFDGRKRVPYTEEDAPNPLSAYGRSKLKGEEAILSSRLERLFIIRTSWLYGPGGKNFVETIARLAADREELRLVADQFGTPTYTRDLAEAIFKLLTLDTPRIFPNKHPGFYGMYHFSDAGQCNWYEFGKEIIRQLRQANAPVKAQVVVPIRTEDYPLPAVRPQYSVFSKEKYRRATGAEEPAWQESLERFITSSGR